MACSAIFQRIWRAGTSAAYQQRCSATAWRVQQRRAGQVMPTGLPAHPAGSSVMRNVFGSVTGLSVCAGHMARKLLQEWFAVRCVSWWWLRQPMAASMPRWWRDTRGRWRAVGRLWWPSVELRPTWRMDKCPHWTRRRRYHPKRPVALCTGIESVAFEMLFSFSWLLILPGCFGSSAPDLPSLMRQWQERETLQKIGGWDGLFH